MASSSDSVGTAWENNSSVSAPHFSSLSSPEVCLPPGHPGVLLVPLCPALICQTFKHLEGNSGPVAVEQ